MSDFERSILNLRSCFHTRLSEKLGLKVELDKIEVLVEKSNDRDLLSQLEEDNRNNISNRRTSVFNFLKFALDSKLVSRFVNSSVLGRFRPFKRR